MKIITLYLFINIAYAYQHTTSIDRLGEIADHVNRAGTTWTAHKPDLNSMEFDGNHEITYYTGAFETQIPTHAVNGQGEQAEFCENNGLPTNFDARKKWPECKRIIGHIFDQSNCGSCWAVSVVTTFNDRVCIKSKGKIQDYLSANQMLSCCKRCVGRGREGCGGGWPFSAWAYIKKYGLVTGGDYDSGEGCQPYKLEHCDHHLGQQNRTNPYQDCKSLPEFKAPACKLQCDNEKYEGSYKKDNIKAEKYYSISPCAAMNEIFTNGPIVATYAVYEDFYTYKSGVYQFTTGKKVGYHAVRVIGWGEEKGVPYWLVANSWNQHWGDNGFFKIKRGTNEVWFESTFSAASPIVDAHTHTHTHTHRK